jgi:hypothetical protein
MEWIDVNDRMPDECDEVIICVTYSKMHGDSNYPWIISGWHSTFSTTKWLITTLGEEEPIEVSVSHWMPMPEAPKQ